MKKFIYDNLIFFIFIGFILYYTFSKYNKRYTERKKISNLDESKLSYLFVPSYFNILSINGQMPVPLNRNEYSRFENIAKKIKVYVFEYTNILELEFQYSREKLFKKSISSGKIKNIFKIKPSSIYFLSEKNIGDKELEFKFEDITKDVIVKKQNIHK